MNATLDLATALDSTDCDWPGCAREAGYTPHTKNSPRPQRRAASAKPPTPKAKLAASAPEPKTEADDDKAVGLANLVNQIRLKREELLDLQAEALRLLDEIREVVQA